MAFFEKKLNKWLAGFLLGKVPSQAEQDDSSSSHHTTSDLSTTVSHIVPQHTSSQKTIKKNIWTKTSDFLKSGLQEMEKELTNPMEDISIKKESTKNIKDNQQ